MLPDPNDSSLADENNIKSVLHAATIIDTTSDAIFSSSLDRIILSWNSAAEKLLGYSADEIIGQSSLVLVPEDKLQETNLLYKKMLNGRRSSNFETLCQRKDGRLIPVSVTLSAIKDSANKIIGFSSIYRDIRARKLYEKQLLNSQRLLEGIFTSIKDGLMVIDTEYTILKYNDAIARLYGLSGDATGKKCYEQFYHRTEPCNPCTYFGQLHTGQPAYRISNEVRPDGKEFCFETSYFPLTYTDSAGIQGVIVSKRDITDQTRMELEMSRLSNLHLIGEMAASIGHEVRNPMTTVRGFLQFLRDKQDFSEYFDLMISELDRANQIISDFLSLAKDKKVEIQQQNLNTIIESLYPLINADAINSGHQIVLKLKKIPDVLVDKQEIHQLILNLVRNGLEAMPLGGRLTIQTGLRLNQPVLTIRDQGVGIPKELLSKLGTPFFTTKEKGTGMGLPVCYSIAERNKAQIDVKTSSKGTSFIVRFQGV